MNIKTITALTLAGIVVLSIVYLSSIANESENKVRISFLPNIGHLIPIVGTEKDFFANSLGPGIQIKTSLYNSGPQAIESLFSKSIDLAYVGPGPAVNGFLKSENHNIVVLAGAASGGASFIVHPKSSINSIDDFEGKRIAAPPIANTQDVSLRNYLSENGFKPADKGGSVYVLNLPNPEIYTLFAKGDVDAAWVPEPWATLLIEDLGGTRMFYEEEIWPNKEFSSVLLVGRIDYVEQNPKVVEKWIKTNDDIANWINENPQESVKLFNSYIKRELGKSFPDEIIYQALSNIHITSKIVPKSIELFAKRSYDLGYLGRHGYNLDGIFYDVNIPELMVETTDD